MVVVSVAIAPRKHFTSYIFGQLHTQINNNPFRYIVVSRRFISRIWVMAAPPPLPHFCNCLFPCGRFATG